MNNYYTLETLKEFDPSYNREHYTNQADVEKVNKFIKMIEESRNNNETVSGDIVEYTTKHGEFYKNAHIEKFETDEDYAENPVYICESPYVPFVDEYNGRFYTNTSGGAWNHIPKNLKLIGQREKTFCVWGHCGACGNGAVHFKAVVNVWEYVEEGNLYNRMSTKDHSKFHVSIRDNTDYRSDYKYIITKGATSHTAFNTDKEYQAWLKTFNGVEFAGHWGNDRIVFTDKQIEKCLPLEEYQAITDCVIDSELCNATIQECKRVYTDNTVTTYLPYQNNKIPLEGIKVEYMRAYLDLK
jgi:hypothetical protein